MEYVSTLNITVFFRNDTFFFFFKSNRVKFTIIYSFGYKLMVIMMIVVQTNVILLGKYFVKNVLFCNEKRLNVKTDAVQ